MSRGGYYDRGDEWLEALSRKVISRDGNLELRFSSYGDETPAGVDIGLERVWRSSGGSRKPNLEALAQIGRSLQVDAVILLGYQLLGSPYVAASLTIDAYVFDVAAQKLYSKTENVGAYDASNREQAVAPVIASALSQFTSAQGRAPAIQASGKAPIRAVAVNAASTASTTTMDALSNSISSLKTGRRDISYVRTTASATFSARFTHLRDGRHRRVPGRFRIRRPA